MSYTKYLVADVRYAGVDNQLEMAGDFKIKYKCAFKDFQYPFDTQECVGIIILPWKNNHTVALQTSASPISMPEDNRVLSNFEVRDGVDIYYL